MHGPQQSMATPAMHRRASVDSGRLWRRSGAWKHTEIGQWSQDAGDVHLNTRIWPPRIEACGSLDAMGSDSIEPRKEGDGGRFQRRSNLPPTIVLRGPSAEWVAVAFGR